MNIVNDEETLRVRADEIDAVGENKKLRDIIIKLKETVRENNFVGLSAPQVGEPYRIVVLNFNGDIRTLVNPVVYDRKGIELSREKCELDGKQYIIPRNNDISVYYINPMGKMEQKKFVGMAAKVLLHQMDIIDGIFVNDIGLEVGEDFDNATEEEKDAIINMYLDSLDLLQKELEENLKNDEEAKEITDAITFMDKVRKGEVQTSNDREGGDIKD